MNYKSCQHHTILNLKPNLYWSKQSYVELMYYQCKFAIQSYEIFWLNWLVNKYIWQFLTVQIQKTFGTLNQIILLQQKIPCSSLSFLKFIYSEKAINFAKSPPIICLMYCQSNNWLRLRKFCGLLRIYEIYLLFF